MDWLYREIYFQTPPTDTYSAASVGVVGEQPLSFSTIPGKAAISWATALSPIRLPRTLRTKLPPSLLTVTVTDYRPVRALISVYDPRERATALLSLQYTAEDTQRAPRTHLEKDADYGTH
jgi:hypothetical protein